MFTKIADKPKCESVTAAQSGKSSLSLEYTIKPSDKFLHVFELSNTFSTNTSTLRDKEIKTIVTKMDKLYNEVTKSKNATLNDIITLAYSYQNLCHGYIKSNQKEGLRIGKTYILRCLNLVKVDLNTLQETGKHHMWIQSAMKICVYLVKHDRFVEARNHIITAVYVKNIFLHEMPCNMKEQAIFSKKLNWNKLDLKLKILLIIPPIRYEIKVLRRSVERLLRLEKGEEFEIDNLNSGHPTKLEGDISQRLLLFNDIDIEIAFTHINPSLPVKYISHYNDAYKIFTNILWNVSIARIFFYTCRNVREYGKLILDTYEAYKYMAFYVKDVTNRSLLQNMMVNLLSDGVENKDILKHEPVLYSNIKLHLAISYSYLIDVQLENLDAIHPLYMPQRHNAIELEIECLVKDAMKSLEMKIAMSKDDYTHMMSQIDY
ncbi:uncharacterized protein LOC116840329 isoform X5 [Odontomachus brunneus]|uniref:uncharacterized protein LOC116840329 isoform X5 n=1 Tax=Odontomachus brunneus TaxID=486640 RepID=UPI0013F2A307|nr:uncharacterized protein LOC116840329 isoform X5 [Odontomachus brunneus]